MRRFSLVLVAALLASFAFAGPASGATVLRAWYAHFGTNSSNGVARMYAYTSASGAMSLSLKRLRANTTYGIRIRNGSCSTVGTLLATLPSVRTGSTGAVSKSVSITVNQMNSIWYYSRRGTISVRVFNGTSKVCSSLGWNRSTRIYIPGYSINLPVVKSPSGYPWCGVAMYLPDLAEPREPRVTYIHGHARTGMFLPLLNASKINNGAAMIGKTVYVYTSDNIRHKYVIDRVRRHVSSVQNVFGVLSERLWLQTSEGPNYTYPKLVIEAHRVPSAQSRVSYALAHPTPHPYYCKLY